MCKLYVSSTVFNQDIILSKKLKACPHGSVNIYADCINAGFVNPRDVPACASNRLNIQLNSQPDPSSPPCYQDEQLVALQESSIDADAFCPEYLAGNQPATPEFLMQYQSADISSACSCYEGEITVAATATGTPVTPTSSNSNNLAPFQLPEVTTFTPSGRVGSSPNASLEFTFTDPNNGQASTTCSFSWPAAGSPDLQDLPCADPNFVFRFTQFGSFRSFTLALSHTHSGTMYSGTIRIDAESTDRNLLCTYGGSGVGSCDILTGKSPILVPITGVTRATAITSSSTTPSIAPRQDVSSPDPVKIPNIPSFFATNDI